MDKFVEEAQFIIDAYEGWEESEAEDKKRYELAYNFAKEIHKDQYRDEGTPYITHIDGIIDIFKNELSNENYYIWSIAALHDVLEDSDTTYEELKNMFGESIAMAVDLLTKKKPSDIKEYLKNMEDYKYSATVITIKLADRLHNVRSLKNILSTNMEKVDKYIIETENYYLPLAEKYNKKLYEKLVSEVNFLKREI